MSKYKYQFNMEWYDEYGVKTVIWDAQDPEQTKKDLIESGSALEEDIYIHENIGQAHYKDNGKFYDGYRHDEDGNLTWEFPNDDVE